MERDKRRVWWDEKDCERMTKHEMEGLRGLLAAVSYIADASEDLSKRLECIPYGKQRMTMLRGGARALGDDIIGTMTVDQCKQIQNFMKDMVITMVPKLTPGSQNVLINKDAAKMLIECSREKCKMCVADGEESRKCDLYKVLEGVVPLDDYGDGTTCPYYTAEFE